MSEIVGKSFDGDDMRIPLSDVARFLNDAGVEIDPATIQPAVDPRKEMLAEIRQLIKRLSPQHGWFVMLDKLLPALDEMEAKL